MRKRPYESYEVYLEHQQVKIQKPGVEKDLLKVHRQRIDSFVNLMKELLIEVSPPIAEDGPKKGLCAGARKGEEVKAMITLGYDAIGVDLTPTFPLVLQGDFNKALPFDNNVFDVVFSNSIDHVYDLNMFATEMTRITKSGAIMLFCISYEMGGFESVVIDSIKEIQEAFPRFKLAKHGTISNRDFCQNPYTEFVILRKEKRNA